MTVCGCFYVRRPQTVKSQAVLERRKRGGLKTNCHLNRFPVHNRKMGVFVKYQIKTFDRFSL